MRAWTRADVDELSTVAAWSAGDVTELLERPARYADERPVVEQSECVSVGPLAELVRLPAWRRYASCRGQSQLFYSRDTISQTIAVAICCTCGVREQCRREAELEEAGEHYLYGVRGGMTPAERGDRGRQPVSSQSVRGVIAREIVGIAETRSPSVRGM